MIDALKLTAYLGERDRAGDAFLADALIDLCARHEARLSVLLRGVEGFGAKHGLHTAAQLTLSEDLPVVAVAVDSRERVQRLLPEVRALAHSGLVTLERARLLEDGDGAVLPEPSALGEAAKLTVYVGRTERAGGRPAHEAVVATLHDHGVAGASALLGVDGTVDGARRRASAVGRNAEVPVMVISVGDGERIAAALPELRDLLDRPLMTLERVRVCKRDGRRLAEPHPPTVGADAGLELWQKITVHAGEQARHAGAPLYRALVRRLRAEGAAGATALRGIWGYSGDHAPHGDRFWSVRRHVPVLTVVVDRPERIAALYPVIDELTDERGLVTSELVPAAHMM